MDGDLARRIPRLEDHPLADLFPLMEGPEFAELCDDIKGRGLLHPITTLDDKILDGRIRYRACIETGVAIETVPYTGTDPRGFVIASNLHRRHLNESQRAMVAAKLATMPQGARTDLRSIELMSQPEAAKALNVSVPTVKRAVVVRDRAIPELCHAVEHGDIPVSVAAKLANFSVAAQRDAVAEPEKANHIAKQVCRAEREHALAERTIEAAKALGIGKRYGVLYADPPWQFEPYSDVTGMDRAAANHYPTMSLDAIKALQVPSAKDAVLFLWATTPMLLEALEVMRTWGFTYRSHTVWAKDRSGTGYWTRNQHELLLIGTRGSVPAPAPGDQIPSLIAAPRGPHSEKPDLFLDHIERLFPSVPKLELFARKPRPGWDVWGNEVDLTASCELANGGDEP